MGSVCVCCSRALLLCWIRRWHRQVLHVSEDLLVEWFGVVTWALMVHLLSQLKDSGNQAGDFTSHIEQGFSEELVLNSHSVLLYGGARNRRSKYCDTAE